VRRPQKTKTLPAVEIIRRGKTIKTRITTDADNNANARAWGKIREVDSVRRGPEANDTCEGGDPDAETLCPYAEDRMKVELVSITPKAEKIMAYCARVSSPHQDNPEYAGLLKYCADHGHWSVFEMADATFEIVTSRAIAQQLLRHKSFSFQEFSQRYAEVMKYEAYAPRRQDDKNRQNSIDDLPKEIQRWWYAEQDETWRKAKWVYDIALERGVAKECARMILPLNTQTRLYMKGSIRSWIHYLDVRCGADTQLEHREIALAIRTLLAAELPTLAEAFEWV